MPFLIATLAKIAGILGPIIAQIGWSLMTERLVRMVCGTTVKWIQETWFDEKNHPDAAKLLLQAYEVIMPPPEVGK